jgi:hypothetical protein
MHQNISGWRTHFRSGEELRAGANDKERHTDEKDQAISDDPTYAAD